MFEFYAQVLGDEFIRTYMQQCMNPVFFFQIFGVILR